MYDGPIEVFTTPGNVIYASEIEKTCTLNSYKACDPHNQPLQSLSSLDESLNLTSNTISVNSSCKNGSNNSVESFSSSNVNVINESLTNQSTEQVVEGNMIKIIESRNRHHCRNVSLASSVLIESLKESKQFDPLLNPPPVIIKPWQCALLICVPLRLGECNVAPMYLEVRVTVTATSYVKVMVDW